MSHVVALTSGGSLYSWGSGQNGQLALDDILVTNTPKAVPNGKSLDPADLVCSQNYTLVVSKAGALSFFGSLKGFAKFLFESPQKENIQYNKNERFKKVPLKGHAVLVAAGERAFVVYTDRQELYAVSEDMQP